MDQADIYYQLQLENGALKQELQEAEAKMMQATDLLNEEYSNNSPDYVNLLQQYHISQQNEHSLQQQIAQLNITQAELNQQVNYLLNEQTKYQNELRFQDQEKLQLKQQISQLNQVLTKLNADRAYWVQIANDFELPEISHLQKTRQSVLKSQNNEDQAVISQQLRESQEILQNQLSQNQTVIQSEQQQIQELSQNLKQSQQEAAGMHSQLQQSRSRLEELTASQQEAQERAQEQQQQHDNSGKQAAEVDELRRANAQLREKNELLAQRNHFLEQENAALQRQVSDFQALKAELAGAASGRPAHNLSNSTEQSSGTQSGSEMQIETSIVHENQEPAQRRNDDVEDTETKILQQKVLERLKERNSLRSSDLSEKRRPQENKPENGSPTGQQTSVVMPAAPPRNSQKNYKIIDEYAPKAQMNGFDDWVEPEEQQLDEIPSDNAQNMHFQDFDFENVGEYDNILNYQPHGMVEQDAGKQINELLGSGGVGKSSNGLGHEFDKL